MTLLMLLFVMAIVTVACGAVLSWLLSFFGVFIPWYACMVGIWLLYFLVRIIRR